MNPKLRMLLYALAGVGVGLALKFTSGWHWESPAQTSAGQVGFVVGYLFPFVAIALLIGYLSRKRPNSN